METAQIEIELTLTGELAEKVIEAAGSLSKEPNELLADAIEAIIRRDLFVVVLSDDYQWSVRSGRWLNHYARLPASGKE